MKPLKILVIAIIAFAVTFCALSLIFKTEKKSIKAVTEVPEVLKLKCSGGVCLLSDEVVTDFNTISLN